MATKNVAVLADSVPPIVLLMLILSGTLVTSCVLQSNMNQGKYNLLGVVGWGGVGLLAHNVPLIC